MHRRERAIDLLICEEVRNGVVAAQDNIEAPVDAREIAEVGSDEFKLHPEPCSFPLGPLELATADVAPNDRIASSRP